MNVKIATIVFALVFSCTLSAEETEEKEKITIDGSLRQRLETRYDFGPGFPSDAEFSQVLSRIRLGVGYQASDDTSVFIQFQDSRIWGENSGTLRSSDNIDLHQGYLLMKNIEDTGLSLKLGRQELNYGDQRLVGGVGWHNVGRSFDAVTLMYSNGANQIDGFYAQTTESFAGNTDTSFAGLYASNTSLISGEVDVYYFIKNDDRALYGGELGGIGTLTVHTIGSRIKGTLSRAGINYGGEAAWQFGDFGPDTLEAFAVHLDAGLLLSNDYDIRLSAEWNYATGDSDPDDGTVETFDNLFPTNHNKYGYIDFIGWRNLSNLRLGISAAPVQGQRLAVDYHYFARASDQDDVYNVGGAVLLAVPSSVTEEEIGQELDVTYSFTIGEGLSVLTGYSLFMPGDLFELSLGSEPEDAHFVYIQTLFRF